MRQTDSLYYKVTGTAAKAFYLLVGGCLSLLSLFPSLSLNLKDAWNIIAGYVVLNNQNIVLIQLTIMQHKYSSLDFSSAEAYLAEPQQIEINPINLFSKFNQQLQKQT